MKKVQIVIRMDRPGREAVVNEYEKLVQKNPQDAQLRHLLGFAEQLKGSWHRRGKIMKSPGNCSLRIQAWNVIWADCMAKSATLAHHEMLSTEP